MSAIIWFSERSQQRPLFNEHCLYGSSKNELLKMKDALQSAREALRSLFRKSQSQKKNNTAMVEVMMLLAKVEQDLEKLIA